MIDVEEESNDNGDPGSCDVNNVTANTDTEGDTKNTCRLLYHPVTVCHTAVTTKQM